MKKLLYFLTLLLLTSSCRSIQKLVDKGDYDAAIFLAADRLAGKKNKKTKHIQALETAFAKIMDHDMETIAGLNAKDNPYYWKDVLSIINNIEKRQDRIEAFLPLVSKDGYQAKFKFVRTAGIKNEALDGAAAYHYDRASGWLDEAKRTGHKELARKAFYEFEKVEFYRRGFLNTNALITEAREHGKSHILVRLSEKSAGYHEALWSRQLLEDMLDDMPSRFWQIFHTEESGSAMDFTATIHINEALASPERELVHRHVDRKKIKDGWEYVKKRNGEIKTDSLGNKLKRDVYRNVKARVTEIFREKSGMIVSRLVIKENLSGRQIMSEKMRTETSFEDVAVQFQGDRRALCDKDINRIKDFPLPFPTDMEILAGAAELLSLQLEDLLGGINI